MLHHIASTRRYPVAPMMEQKPLPNFEQARTYAIQRLTNELSPALTYHSIAHTCDEVVPAAERIAALAGIDNDDLLLLRTAAYYHDLGFITHYAGHEEASIVIARAVLPTFGYQPEQIERIAGMIRATKLPQSPSNLLEQILADADLDLLGSDDFFERNTTLRTEMANFGGAMTNEGWYANQLKFVQAHTYWTPAAAQLRNAGKLRSIAILNDKLAHTERTPWRIKT